MRPTTRPRWDDKRPRLKLLALRPCWPQGLCMKIFYCVFVLMRFDFVWCFCNSGSTSPCGHGSISRSTRRTEHDRRDDKSDWNHWPTEYHVTPHHWAVTTTQSVHQRVWTLRRPRVWDCSVPGRRSTGNGAFTCVTVGTQYRLRHPDGVGETRREHSGLFPV